MEKTEKMSKIILITGAGGLIGKVLTETLIQRGYKVHILSRSKTQYPNKNVNSFQWNLSKEQIDPACIKGVDAIIHLAGEGIANQRWTKRRKKKLLESRTKSIKLIYSLLEKYVTHRVKTVISASGTGYYGNRSNEILTEESPPSDTFLAQLCIRWENAVQEGSKLHIRTVNMRTGFVLSNQGGALTPMTKLTKRGLGSTLGDGAQWVSWIHMEDVIQMYIFALEHPSIHGIYNMVAPHPTTNKIMTTTLAQLFKKLLWLPAIPAWVLKLVLGEMSVLALDSARVSSDKILSTGFKFKFSTIDSALRNIYLR